MNASILPMGCRGDSVRGDDSSSGGHGIPDPHSPMMRSLACHNGVMHTYTVTIETGKSRWAGTEAQVCIQLFGEHGTTEAIPLRKSDYVSAVLRYAAPSSSPVKFGFSEGSVCEFRFSASFMGNLQKICLFHGSAEDYGHAASWRLERVAVRNETLVRTWQFNCETWLTRDAGNEIELYPSQETAAGSRASMRMSLRGSLGCKERSLSSNYSILANRFSKNNTDAATVSTNATNDGVCKVCFQVQKDDMQKGFMYLYGEIPALGSGDPSHALRMVAYVGADGKWGAEWRLELEIDENYDTIEYRYIHLDGNRERAFQSNKPLSLKLSDASYSGKRTMKGGKVYVKDIFNGVAFYRSSSRFATLNQSYKRVGHSVAPVFDSKALLPSPLRHTNNRYRNLPSRRAPSMQSLFMEKVRKDVLDARREIQNLEKGVDDLRLRMAEKCTVYESRQAELVRLVNDYNESRSNERKKLIKQRDEIHARWTLEYVERRKLFNAIQELRGKIRVFCRVRPLKTTVQKCGAPANLSVSFPNANLGEQNAIKINDKTFEFSHVFDPSATQEAVYNETSGVIGSILDGYNVYVLAYGQTGSGKTYTMNGPPDDRGVNFRAITNLFASVKERSDYSDTRIIVSMIEIYNDTLKDLIYDKEANGNRPAPELEIRRDVAQESNTTVHIPNVTEVEVLCVDEVWEVMEIGAHNRAMAATDMNQHSSRSHIITRVRVDMHNYRTGSKSSGLLSLVDLAGADSEGRSKASVERLKETQHINKSLGTLDDVLTALLQKSAHVPYQNSKLTYLLQDSLGGDSRTLMFVNVSCDESDSSDTLLSLQFAQRVAKVELRSARKHTANTVASKVLSALNEKEAQNQALRSKNLKLQCDLKKREYALKEQREQLHQKEEEPRNAAKHDDENRKRETSEYGGVARESLGLPIADDKREFVIRNLKWKLREVSRTKDDEGKKWKSTVEDKERKIRILESRLKTATSRVNLDTGSASTPASHSRSVFGSEPLLTIVRRARKRIPRDSMIGYVRSQSESTGTRRPLRLSTTRPSIRIALATQSRSSVFEQTT